MKIVVNEGGTWSAETMASNLSQNYLTQPVVRDLIEYAEPRQLITLIASGVEYDGQISGAAKRTKIGIIDRGKLIGASRYDYKIMGRIQQKSVIIAQVGTSQTDGTFVVQMNDNLLYEGVVVRFYTGRQARVQSNPVGSPGNYIVRFQTMDAQTFVWATEVTAQPGEKSCMGFYTAYGEASRTSGSNNFAPSIYTGHVTIQRKTGWITGDAMSQITNLYKMGPAGPGDSDAKPLGWYWTQERQSRIQWAIEDDGAKWDGVSTMRDANGVLQVRSLVQDREGKDVITGDGVITQIAGSNDMSPSGSDGMPTIDDFKDMMSVLQRNSAMVEGNVWYVATGSDGYDHAQEVLVDYWNVVLGGRSNVDVGADGSGEISVGALFNTFSFAGNKLVFVKNVRWDDMQLYPATTITGKSVKGSSYVFINNGFNTTLGVKNFEILAKGANGVNRSMVTNYVGGLTGHSGVISTSGVDAQEYNMLKQDGVFVYNTMACGLINALAA